MILAQVSPQNALVLFLVKHTLVSQANVLENWAL
jgi:hypothetical protein